MFVCLVGLEEGRRHLWELGFVGSCKKKTKPIRRIPFSCRVSASLAYLRGQRCPLTRASLDFTLLPPSPHHGSLPALSTSSLEKCIVDPTNRPRFHTSTEPNGHLNLNLNLNLILISHPQCLDYLVPIPHLTTSPQTSLEESSQSL